MVDNNQKSGYGRPPKSSQFRPGESGNPRGRPKRRPSFRDDFNAELREKISAREDGREKKFISKQRALIKALMALAIRGNVRAITTVIASFRNFDLGQHEPATDSADPMDLDILSAFVAREQRRTSNTDAKRSTAAPVSKRPKKTAPPK